MFLDLAPCPFRPFVAPLPPAPLPTGAFAFRLPPATVAAAAAAPESCGMAENDEAWAYDDDMALMPEYYNYGYDEMEHPEHSDHVHKEVAKQQLDELLAKGEEMMGEEAPLAGLPEADFVGPDGTPHARILRLQQLSREVVEHFKALDRKVLMHRRFMENELPAILNKTQSLEEETFMKMEASYEQVMPIIEKQEALLTGILDSKIKAAHQQYDVERQQVGGALDWGLPVAILGAFLAVILAIVAYLAVKMENLNRKRYEHFLAQNRDGRDVS